MQAVILLGYVERRVREVNDIYIHEGNIDPEFDKQ